jgi:hypothetical protein
VAAETLEATGTTCENPIKVVNVNKSRERVFCTIKFL